MTNRFRLVSEAGRGVGDHAVGQGPVRSESVEASIGLLDQGLEAISKPLSHLEIMLVVDLRQGGTDTFGGDDRGCHSSGRVRPAMQGRTEIA